MLVGMSSSRRLSVLSSHRSRDRESAEPRGSFGQMEANDGAALAGDYYEAAQEQFNSKVAEYRRQADAQAAFEQQQAAYEQQQQYLLHLLHTDPLQYHGIMQDQLRLEQEAQQQLQQAVQRLSQPVAPQPPQRRQHESLHPYPSALSTPAFGLAPPSSSSSSSSARDGSVLHPLPPTHEAHPAPALHEPTRGLGQGERSRFSHLLQSSADRQASSAAAALQNSKLSMRREQVLSLSVRVAQAMHAVAEQPALPR